MAKSTLTSLLAWAGHHLGHLLFCLAAVPIRVASHPGTRGGGGGLAQLQEPRGDVRARVRAEGAGRAARAPRRPQTSLPHLTPLLRSLLGASYTDPRVQ